MPPGAPARLALALGLGLWLGGLASPGRGCGPCAPPCLCGPAPGAACRVNCSGRGLRTLGPALRIPADTTALSLDVWIGFSAVEGPEAGLAPQGEAFNLESCQNWLPGEPHPATAEHCVRLGPEGQCNTDLCSAPHSYVCELRPGGPVWDAENFLMGVPDGGLQGPLILLTPQEGLMPPRHPVEVMVFSGLSPNRESFLTTAEFETQELEEPAQLRLQVQPSGGAGTTAHVGIMLYGADSRSGHRHLDGDRAFHRNSLDIFRIATPHSLGNVWKIRVWHDNKGLSPAWFLQHIIVRDLQSARSTFFLVNDWLSVETEANGGLVEKEVLAASDAALWQFQRLLVAELQCGFFDKHIWLSLWDRPARSRFTRVQRATCCVLLICLFLGANAVWYGVVGDATYSVGPVSHLISSSVDTVAIGLVSSVAVCPVYLAILFLFRMSRSKQVAGGPNPSPTRQRALELDSCLDSSILDSSFLTFSGLRTEVRALQAKAASLAHSGRSEELS